MPVSIFAGCTQLCGWPAALLAIVGFGSFGVPIKSASSVLDVHPLVMQSYKTWVCFLTCWFVHFLGEEIRWTRWGIVSGMFWVPAATCGIYGIRNAGLTICVGTWSSCQVVTSFIFGILIFKEEVKDVVQTALAFLTLCIGLVGMSMYSKPPKVTKKLLKVAVANSDTDDEEVICNNSTKRKLVETTIGCRAGQEESEALLESDHDSRGVGDKERLIFFGGKVALTKRQLGIAGAIVNGLWGGLNLIPLHYARKDGFGGAAYLVSYACGSMIVNTGMWILYWLYFLQRKGFNLREATNSLPDFHLDQLWKPGFLAGTLYSIANFGSILSVTYLGQGVGFSLCQVQILVSGLWGILYFQEITGRETITKWLISASITVCGILWLTYQKVH